MLLQILAMVGIGYCVGVVAFYDTEHDFGAAIVWPVILAVRAFKAIRKEL